MSKYDQKYDDFIEWVKRMMVDMRLTHDDVAKHGCSRPLVTSTLGKNNNPGLQFYLAVAGALKTSLDEVCMRAGLIGDIKMEIETAEAITRELADLPPEDQQAAKDFILFLKDKRKKDDNDDRDRIEKAEQLTTKQRATVIKNAQVISIARQKSTPKKTRTDNRHPSTVRQSLSP